MTVTSENGISTGDIIAAAAIRLAGERGWRNLTMGDIATEADITLAELSRWYVCRPEILDGFERMIDRRMLAGASAGDVDDKPRDRLFDIIMERLDALVPYKDGVRRITRELPFDPASGLVLGAAMPRSIAWMFAGARIAVDGPAMPVKLAILGGVYLSTFRVWLSDDSQDLGKTMASLDKRLDRCISMIGGGSRPSQPTGPVPSDGPPDIAEPEPAAVAETPPAPAKAVAPKKPRAPKKPPAAK